MHSSSHLRPARLVPNTPAASSAAPYGFPASNGGIRPACPQCRGALIRVWRRPIDRFTTQFVPVHRFRCDAFSCGWEGNLRVDGADNGKKPSVLERVATASAVVLGVTTSVALAAMVVLAMIGWTNALD
jgi:hypothetical protein